MQLSPIEERIRHTYENLLPFYRSCNSNEYSHCSKDKICAHLPVCKPCNQDTVDSLLIPYEDQLRKDIEANFQTERDAKRMSVDEVEREKNKLKTLNPRQLLIHAGFLNPESASKVDVTKDSKKVCRAFKAYLKERQLCPRTCPKGHVCEREFCHDAKAITSDPSVAATLFRVKNLLWRRNRSTFETVRHVQRQLKQEAKGAGSVYEAKIDDPVLLHYLASGKDLPSFETLHLLYRYPDLRRVKPLNTFAYNLNSCYCDAPFVAMFGIPNAWTDAQLEAFPARRQARLEEVTQAFKEGKPISAIPPSYPVCVKEWDQYDVARKELDLLEPIYKETTRAIASLRSFLKLSEEERKRQLIEQTSQEKSIKRFTLRTTLDLLRQTLEECARMSTTDLNDAMKFIEVLFKCLLFDRSFEILVTDLKTNQVHIEKEEMPWVLMVTEPLTLSTLIAQQDGGYGTSRELFDAEYLILSVFKELHVPLELSHSIQTKSDTVLYLSALVCRQKDHFYAYFRYQNRWFYYNDQDQDGLLHVVSFEMMNMDARHSVYGIFLSRN